MFFSWLVMSMLVFLFMESFQFFFGLTLLLLFFFYMIIMVGESQSFFNSILFYVDFLSVLLICLSVLIIYFVIMFNLKYKNKMTQFLFYMIFIILFFCFLSSSFLILYIFFEFSLVPLIIVIFMKGSNLERYSASFYLLIFTFSSSMLMLLSFVLKNKNILFFMHKYFYFYNNNSMFLMMMSLLFLVKFPIYGFHFWLPKAHVEASVEGSMILASIMLKLGGFGFNRLFSYLTLGGMMNLINLIMVLASAGSLLAGLICYRQVDLKIMIAYSSVSHMGLLILGLCVLSSLGLSGGVLLMLAHGFCSSALFFIGNMFYERCFSRNIFLMKGMENNFRLLMIIWLGFCLFNMAVPPSMNFFSEMMLLLSILKKSSVFMLILGLNLFISVLFSLNLFVSVSHGKLWYNKMMKKECFLDLLVLNLHLFFLLVFVFKLNMFFGN
uniref:NADH-ubiquinone oxidoreductase chain 4 n=1 Tax=Amblyseiulella paraheveae TaxID=3049516 RepID=A0AAU6PBU6_9ACAR